MEGPNRGREHLFSKGAPVLSACCADTAAAAACCTSEGLRGSEVGTYGNGLVPLVQGSRCWTISRGSDNKLMVVGMLLCYLVVY